MKVIARIAAAYQSSGGTYKADAWGTTTLNPGDRVWGGIPYPTKFFTDWATLSEYMQLGYSHAIWDALQVSPHAATQTVRGGMAEYVVLYGLSVPYGRCLANTQFGSGGGYQYIIDSPESVLARTGTRSTSRTATTSPASRTPSTELPPAGRGDGARRACDTPRGAEGRAPRQSGWDRTRWVPSMK
jgi:hypothetical protein